MLPFNCLHLYSQNGNTKMRRRKKKTGEGGGRYYFSFHLEGKRADLIAFILAPVVTEYCVQFHTFTELERIDSARDSENSSQIQRAK